MTINKSQEQSMNMVGVDLREDYYSHGNICYIPPVPELTPPESLTPKGHAKMSYWNE